MTGLMDRSLVVCLGSLAVVRKRASRGSLATGAPGAQGAPGSAKERRITGPSRALSSNVSACCAIVEG